MGVELGGTSGQLQSSLTSDNIIRLAAREVSVFVMGSNAAGLEGVESGAYELALEPFRKRWVKLCRKGAAPWL
jgi:hypothetical protein